MSSWEECPMLGTDFVTSALVAVGAKFYRKGNLKLLYSPCESFRDGMWRHASISHHARYPTWDEILDVRYSFFPDDVEVFQMLPPKSEYLNFHKNCFHLWSPIGRRFMPVELRHGA